MASLPLEVHPEAQLEALEAHDWYAAQSQEAAATFQQELRDATRTIQANPMLWARYLYDTRRYLIKRFPFVIVYRVTEVRIEILAVAHGSRKPGYWRRRLA